MHVPNGIRPHAPSHQTQTKSSLSTHIATAPLPTRHGVFTTHVFASAAHAPDPDGTAPEKEHVALVFGDVSGKSGVLARVHSECLTSEVFGSLKCDCKEQLDAAMAEAARRRAGVILYLRQEGRGIGLGNKIRAYDLQSRGHDTVDANRLLGLPDDVRRYGVARDMLEWLGVKSVRLMTNNPEKITGLRALGVNVLGRVPVVVPPNPHSAGYLEAKRLRMAHELPQIGVEPLPRAANGDAE
jgi:GTP cyclohydrolase II